MRAYSGKGEGPPPGSVLLRGPPPGDGDRAAPGGGGRSLGCGPSPPRPSPRRTRSAAVRRAGWAARGLPGPVRPLAGRAARGDLDRPSAQRYGACQAGGHTRGLFILMKRGARSSVSRQKKPAIGTTVCQPSAQRYAVSSGQAHSTPGRHDYLTHTPPDPHAP